ncbi:MAG: ribonuclease HII [Spirochaetaceae bacterium]|nr:ribonuclease HII [Spirochaetaceae bacterium]
MAFVFGIDEAGRGPLAGPVYAACCILPDDFPVELLNDSKALSEKKRAKVEPIIKEKAIAYGIGFATHTEIDQINILQATLLAMKRAFDEMFSKLKTEYPSLTEGELFGVIDGNCIPNISCSCKAEPKADGNYPCVMAASILAKNERDRVMVEYSKMYPEYGYEGHKGYPTKSHKEKCHQLGPSPIQRHSFKY